MIFVLMMYMTTSKEHVEMRLMTTKRCKTRKRQDRDGGQSLRARAWNNIERIYLLLMMKAGPSA